MRNMRRSDRQMTIEDAVKLLRSGEYGILSTVDNENQPYGTPISYAYSNNYIYIHSANEGTKLDNIKNNSRVCFTVVGRTKILPQKFSTEFESVMVFGVCSIAVGDDKVTGLRELIKKYSPEFIPEGEAYIERAKDKATVVKIDILNLTGKHRK